MVERSSAESDPVLVGRGPGEPAEFERLALPHLADVARFARSLTRDAARAEDLVQETFSEALRRWQTAGPVGAVKPWLLAVCHDAFARSMQEQACDVDGPNDDPELDSLATAIAHWTAESAGLAAIIDRMDLRPGVDRALAALPMPFRGAVVLVDVEGHSYDDAAQILGVVVPTLRSRLFRGRKLLQDLLFEYARDRESDLSRPSQAAAPHSHSLNSPTLDTPATQVTQADTT